MTKQLEFKGNGNDFSASHDAENWCKSHGFTVGPMCRENPRGISRKHGYIAKWDNIRVHERALVEGIMTSDDPRHGPVFVLLFVEL